MKRQRGFQTDHLRRLFRGGLRRPAPATGQAPHIEVPAPTPPPLQDLGADRGEPRDLLRGTFERWTRLNAPLPEELIRRGLVVMRIDRNALGESVRFAEAGCCESRIYRSEHFVVDVVCWRSGQIGPIQDHGDSARGLLVVEGKATEILFEDSPCGRLAPLRSHFIPQGTVSMSRVGEVHAVGNLQAPGVDLIALCIASPATGTGRKRGLSDTIFGGMGAGG